MYTHKCIYASMHRCIHASMHLLPRGSGPEPNHTAAAVAQLANWRRDGNEKIANSQ